MSEIGRCHIGTSGWHYKHWVGTFYPKGTKDAEQLGYYVRDFKSVELNNSFYRLPSVRTFESWKKSVPEDFVFALKASRYLTHLKKLILDKKAIDQFLQHADHLAEKLGPILFQLPPNWKVNVARLESFLDYLPKSCRYTFEFRDHSWYTHEVFELLRKYKIAFCIYELAGHRSPLALTANFVYVRLHGPGDKYQGSYTAPVLKEWAEKCQRWQKEGKDVYFYFDNDERGYAAENAKKLIAIMRG